MAVNDVKTDAHDVKVHDTAPHTDGSKLSARELLTDPQDFLKTLQHLQQDPHRLHPNDALDKIELENIATHDADAKVRSTAQIAHDHFDEMAGMYNRYEGYKAHGTPGISNDDLQFALDLNNHDTTGYALRDAALDVGSGALKVVEGGLLGLFGDAMIYHSGWGLPVGGSFCPSFPGEFTLGTAFGFGLAGIGAAVAVGGLGYYGYEAYKERGRVNAMADKESQTFRRWLDKQAS